MTSPIILTLAQARDLQQQITAWPSGWYFLLAIERPEKPDAIGDPERMTAGLKMVQLGCRDDHIAEQLGWKMPSGPLKTIHRILKKAKLERFQGERPSAIVAHGHNN